MSLRNTLQGWGWLSKTFHWFMAVLILVQIPLGLYAVNLKLSPLKLDVFLWHKSIGILILLLVTIRLLWRLNNIIPVALDNNAWLQRLASLVHNLLYGLMFLLPLSGWVISSSANIPVKLFWLIPLPSLVDPDPALKLLATEVHYACVVILIITLVMHIGGAAMHHFWLRDNILRRMWF